MIRDTLSEDSMHYSLFATGRMGLANQYRACTGCTGKSFRSPDLQDRSVWLKVVMFENVFRAYYKSQGMNWWTQLGEQRIIPFSSLNFFIGVAVTSHSNSKLAKFTGSNIKV